MSDLEDIVDVILEEVARGDVDLLEVFRGKESGLSSGLIFERTGDGWYGEKIPKIDDEAVAAARLSLARAAALRAGDRRTSVRQHKVRGPRLRKGPRPVRPAGSRCGEAWCDDGGVRGERNMRTAVVTLMRLRELGEERLFPKILARFFPPGFTLLRVYRSLELST